MDPYGRVRETLTNRCQAVRKLKEKRRKTQRGTRDRHTNSEQFEFECQLKTPTRSRIQELLNLGTSSLHNLFQLLIINQDLLRLREGRHVAKPQDPKKGVVVPSILHGYYITDNVLHATDYGPQNNFPPPCHNVTPALKMARRRNFRNLDSRKMRRA